MRLHEFELLEVAEQAEYLWQHGVHVATRKLVFHSLLLFQTSRFYGEIIYNGVENKIVTIRAFASAHRLEPYLKDIDLSEILAQV